MVREISAGGVVVRRMDNGEGWSLAAIEPQREDSASKGKSAKTVLALPKGLVDKGETAEQTAVREIFEETGLTATLITKLADIKYVYVRTWGDQQRVFKIVSFYLLKYKSGRIDEISPNMRIEVKHARWIPLEGAEKALTYKGEKDMARRAVEYLKLHPEV
jgi:8-oxo-dGTP pyrophosphatase MutT (NUDIX family)